MKKTIGQKIYKIGIYFLIIANSRKYCIKSAFSASRIFFAVLSIWNGPRESWRSFIWMYSGHVWYIQFYLWNYRIIQDLDIYIFVSSHFVLKLTFPFEAVHGTVIPDLCGPRLGDHVPNSGTFQIRVSIWPNFNLQENISVHAFGRFMQPLLTHFNVWMKTLLWNYLIEPK